MTYFWPENGNCIIFDESNAVLDEIYTFIETTIDAAESVLVHSIDGASRACFCCAVYFMLKYRWTMEKTLSYLQSKRPDLMPRPGFMRHLAALDQSLKRVTHAAGVTTAALKRYTTWDISVLCTWRRMRVLTARQRTALLLTLCWCGAWVWVLWLDQLRTMATSFCLPTPSSTASRWARHPAAAPRLAPRTRCCGGLTRARHSTSRHKAGAGSALGVEYVAARRPCGLLHPPTTR